MYYYTDTIDNQDLNITTFNVIFPADEDEASPITGVNAPIPILDDDINEAVEQYFIVQLIIASAVDPDTLNIGCDVATCIIQDDDGESEL